MADTGRILTIEEWNAWWKKNYEKKRNKDPAGQVNESALTEEDFDRLSPMLVKNKESLFAGEVCARMFVPLSGKSPDVKWLSEQGHEVIGVECSEHAILDFFESNSIAFDKSSCQADENFQVYKAKEWNITIYEGDFFKFTQEIAGGLVDGISDTASLNTIDFKRREEYVEVMRKLMKRDGRYLLSAWNFGEVRTWKDNPYDLTENDVKSLFDSSFTWKKIDEDVTEWGIDQIYLITLK